MRIYTPYLDQPKNRAINYVAIEPVVGDRRAFSELEPSGLDGVPGKRLWSASSREDVARERPPWEPAQPIFGKEGDHEAMAVFVGVEPFQNGASPVIELWFRKDRPYEAAFRVLAAEGSAAAGMTQCILTATMGNYARLRRLWLAGKVVEPAELWPDFRGHGPWAEGFTPHRQWNAGELLRIGGEVIVMATPGESDPASITYGPDTPIGWRYKGAWATQYWRAKAQEGLVARVNARQTYWGTEIDIPGGLTCENLELAAPFRAGQEFVFGATRLTPESITRQLDSSRSVKTQ